jgi:protocatechuate 3,4-dioxygenase beta subunit
MFQSLRWLALGIVCAVALSLPAHLHAQAGTGSIWGTVTDNHGSPLGGAKVTLVSEETKVSTGASTDGTGQYRFEGLKPGTYDVTFDAQGLVPRTQHLKVKAGRKTNLSERLKPPPEPDTPSR